MRIGTKRYTMDDRHKELLILSNGQKVWGVWLHKADTFRETARFISEHENEWERVVYQESPHTLNLPYEEKTWLVYGIGELK
jgi:hypothetical protein